MSMEFVGSSKKLPAAKHLTDTEYKILMETYAKHNKSMGVENRAKYSIGNVIKVKVVEPNKILGVHYSDGEWWHYTKDHSWY